MQPWVVVSCPVRPVNGPMLKTSYCVAAPNSSGAGALMSAHGSNSIAAADLTLSASPTTNQPGLFFYGPNQVAFPFGHGFRCVGGTIQRLPVISGGFGGQQVLQVDFAVHGPLLASLQTANFQLWYRDPSAGPPGFNLSDGLQIPFWP